MRSKLIRVTVACACFLAGVCVESIRRYVQQPRSVEIRTEAVPAPAPQPIPQETSADYPEDEGIGPFDIEFFIDDHPYANLERLWQRLKITDVDPNGYFSFGDECGNCKANTFQYDLDNDASVDAVLQIKQADSYRYLIFNGYDWKFLGHIDVWAKYPPADPVVLVSNGKAWLIVQSTAGTSSGLSAWHDTVYEVSNRGVRRVGSYLAEVNQSGLSSLPSKSFVGRPVSCEIKNGRAVLTVSYKVEYFGFANDELPLFAKEKKAVIVTSLTNGSSFIDPARSAISPDEFQTIYNFDSMDEEEFLKYNRAELRAIAAGSNSEKKKWLKEFLKSIHR